MRPLNVSIQTDLSMPLRLDFFILKSKFYTSFVLQLVINMLMFSKTTSCFGNILIFSNAASYSLSLCVCVCVCVRACVRACLRACVRASERAHVNGSVCVRVHMQMCERVRARGRAIMFVCIS